jgi:hypothetical protein
VLVDLHLYKILHSLFSTWFSSSFHPQKALCPSKAHKSEPQCTIHRLTYHNFFALKFREAHNQMFHNTSFWRFQSRQTNRNRKVSQHLQSKWRYFMAWCLCGRWIFSVSKLLPQLCPSSIKLFIWRPDGTLRLNDRIMFRHSCTPWPSKCRRFIKKIQKT